LKRYLVMHCVYCRKKIGFLRRLTDTEYCCPDHGVKMRALSARAIRDQALYGESLDDISSVFVKPLAGLWSRSSQASSGSGSTLIFSVLMIVALVVGVVGLPKSDEASDDHLASTGDSVTGFRAKLRSYAAVKLTDDFKSGLNSWISVEPSTSQAPDWSYRDGFVRPGRLRLLKNSLSMTDYHIEFIGEVEQKGLSWVYRAKDSANYYASKIVVTKPGPLPRANLVRYAVINGAEQNRVSVPLPVAARADALYKVQMTVSANDFSAMVNGAMVDNWSDTSLRKGGVGFFSDKGELATLRYVTITDKDTFIGRVLSHLGFLHPIAPLF
jgi:hypothetical protein